MVTNVGGNPFNLRKNKMTDKTIKLAAKACYFPTQDKEKQCMAWIIERLVLPNGIHGFTEEEIEIYIDDAVKKVSLLPLPDYDTVKKEEDALFKRQMK
jgi:hypothetical protein